MDVLLLLFLSEIGGKIVERENGMELLEVE